jgi:hypothetical protein
MHTAETPDEQLNRDYWHVTQSYLDRLDDALHYSAPNPSSAEWSALRAVIYRSIAEGCVQENDLTIAKINLERAHDILGTIHSVVREVGWIDEFHKFIYDFEYARTLFLEYSAGTADPGETKGLIEEVLRTWDNWSPVVGAELEINLGLKGFAESQLFLKKYLDAIDMIKQAITKPAALTNYARLGMSDRRFCQ